MAIIGIDLGTTISLVSVWIDGKSVLIPNSFGSYFTPSAVSIDSEDKVIVGQIAKERLITHPAYSVSSFKKHMGANKEFFLGEQRYTAEVLSALVLSQLKRGAEAFLGETVSEAIIIVPAYFNDSQRNATKLAGKLAGLSVSRLINEPSAAALYYNMLNPNEENSFLVFDFGGGTLG